MRNDKSELIRFTATLNNSWEKPTRGGELASPIYELYTVEKSKTAADANGNPLYLHTEVREGFPTSDPNLYTESELEEMSTRAQDMINGTSDFYSDFGVSAYLYNDNWDENGGEPNYFQNQRVLRQENGDYDLTSSFFWPRQEQKMRFAAYAPFGTASNAGQAWCNFPAVSIASNAVLNTQVDLLTCMSEEIFCDNKAPVHLKFKHALAAIRFEVGTGLAGATIKHIGFTNAKINGVIDISTGETPIVWHKGYAILNPNFLVNNNSRQDILEGKVFLLPPQTTYEDNQLEIVVNNGGSDQWLFFPLGNKRWDGGKTYTYRISNSNYQEIVEVRNGSESSASGNVSVHFPYSGNSPQNVTLISTIGGVTPQPLAWKTSFKPEGATEWSSTPPDWLHFQQLSGAGDNGTGSSIQIDVSPRVGRVVDLDAVVRSSSKGSASSRFNLASNKQNAVIDTTANCYVVSRYGYYQFPLVYGNAITNEGVNIQAFKGPSGTPRDEGNVLSTFVDHLGNDLVSPYILTQGASSVQRFNVSRATILWQDYPNLLTNVKYEPTLYGGVGGVTFDIAQENARQGNAVIALYDDLDRIVWSWHIWVTPMGGAYTVPIETSGGHIFDLDAVNLGWVSFAPIIDYQVRSCKVRFESASGSGISAELEVVQQPHAKLTPGDALYYQWGRKDPFRGRDNNLNILPIENEWPNLDRNIKTPKRKLLSWRTQHPNIYHNMARTHQLTAEDRLDLSKITDDLCFNLWDSQNARTNTQADYQTVKSIYDPCPPGFKIAPPATFTFATTTGWASTDPTTWNMKYDAVQNGFMAYSHTGAHVAVLFPLCGYRDYDAYGGLLQHETDGYIWTTGAWNNSNAYYFCYCMGRGDNHINPSNAFLMGDGFSVRGVRDKAVETSSRKRRK